MSNEKVIALIENLNIVKEVEDNVSIKALIRYLEA